MLNLNLAGGDIYTVIEGYDAFAQILGQISRQLKKYSLFTELFRSDRSIPLNLITTFIHLHTIVEFSD